MSALDGRDDAGNPDSAIDDSMAVSVLIVNEAEPGSLTLAAARPRVGSSLVAILTDQDGVVGEAEWVWHRSTGPSQASEAGWQVVTGATSFSYSPVEADLGHHLRATAAYDDGHGPDKRLRAVSEAQVVDLQGPIFTEAEVDRERALGPAVQRSVAETAVEGADVGEAVAAESPGGGAVTYTLHGEHAALFEVASSTGQISVGPGTDLDYESGRTAYTLWLTATDSSGAASTVAVVVRITDVELTDMGRKYDADGNEVIDREEVVAAVTDYFRALLTKQETIELIRLYFTG